MRKPTDCMKKVKLAECNKLFVSSAFISVAVPIESVEGQKPLSKPTTPGNKVSAIPRFPESPFIRKGNQVVEYQGRDSNPGQ